MLLEQHVMNCVHVGDKQTCFTDGVSAHECSAHTAAELADQAMPLYGMLQTAFRKSHAVEHSG